ncbi:hypothetical protein CJD36_020625 [Flavipsychrobacter stenotrophus]|uniref:DUF4175 domain-containing protein n=1 Tax=Flavipsychrobacter stenotrophus TaxID=2077091 RepID=A0A2S7SQK8_9BACT|nr:DUF4175 family protein [Flavipsychrobacter stenotrophus]PQJ09193.1 hypothetical protein CJD36_020625 [Flavipsychrobacter stenotrophus]
MNNYEWLIGSLDAFIRKFYANKVLRGTLVFLSCLLFYVLLVTVGEYYLYLPVGVRIGIVSAFLLLGGISLVAWVIIPLTKMAKLGKVISHEQAAEIIGSHFTEVSDKLLNILQLKSQVASSESRELAEASINQKISQISLVPMSSAIDLSKNKKYLPFLLPLLLVGIFLLVAAPNVFTEASTRLLQPTKAFEKPAPFQFIIKNTNLTATRNTDFILTVEMKGNTLPAEASVEIGSERVQMQPLENHTFQYTFKNPTAAVKFRIFAAGFYSNEFTLKVAQRPVLKSFKVDINYPAYIGKKNEVRSSLGDMVLPVGTTVTWALFTEHTDAASIRFGEAGTPVVLNSTEDMYGFKYRFMADTAYTITLRNNQSVVADSYRYQVQVIPDQYPVIQTQQVRDTITGKQILITGTAGDDYAITRATFNYEITADKKSLIKKSLPLKISQGALTSFEQYFDVNSLNLQPGHKVTYFIEAWDNDGVHGNKSTRSEVMSYQAFDAKQLDSAINENSKAIRSGLSKSAQETKQMQSDYKDMQSKMLQSDKMDWEQQQDLQEMLKKQENLKTQLENVKQKFDEQIQQSEQKKYSDEVKEKQKALQEQMNNLLNKELQEQLKKLQEMMQKLNKDQAVDAMKQMQQENKLFNMDMQRMQELMAKLEQQMKIEDMANKVDELAKKEDALSKETDASKKETDQLKKDQEDLKKELEKTMKEDMKEIEKLAEKTKKEEGLNDAEKKAEDAKKDMEQSEQELDKKDNKKAGKSQKSAAKKLQDMAQAMRKGAESMDAEQLDIDIRAVRQLLSNLIRLSFDQEALMNDVKRTSTASQAYVENQEEQHRLLRNSMMIKDSLFALSKRNDKLPALINKNTTDLEHYMQLSVDALENRNVGGALMNQQYVMTKTNDLALMLNEMLSNLMQQQDQEGGEGKCMKPGGKKPKPGPGDQMKDIITEQEKLGNAMQQMQRSQANKPGKKPGEKPGDKPGDKPGQKPGDKPGQGQGNKPGGKQPGQQGSDGQGGGGSGSGDSDNENGDPEQLARLAEQQAQIRRKIQELSSLLNSKGQNGNSKTLRELEQKMDKNETDIVNRRLTAEMIQRQREILTRLLEVDKAVREQEQDDKRSSESAKEISRPIPPMLQKYRTDQKQLLDLYKTVPPQLKPYYKNMVENYFHIIGNK